MRANVPPRRSRKARVKVTGMLIKETSLRYIAALYLISVAFKHMYRDVFFDLLHLCVNVHNLARFNYILTHCFKIEIINVNYIFLFYVERETRRASVKNLLPRLNRINRNKRKRSDVLKNV